MRPEQQIQRAPRAVRHAGVMTGEATQLDAIAARLMAVQRHWNDPDRALYLAAALAAGVPSLPADVQHNLLTLSVYADTCESDPSADALGSLIALTHALAGSLRQWPEAAPPQFFAPGRRLADLPRVAAQVGTVRPGRVRNRTTKTEPEEKVKKPADGVRDSKKSPPARKAPARGRYVDEYARPVH